MCEADELGGYLSPVRRTNAAPMNPLDEQIGGNASEITSESSLSSGFPAASGASSTSGTKNRDAAVYALGEHVRNVSLSPSSLRYGKSTGDRLEDIIPASRLLTEESSPSGHSASVVGERRRQSSNATSCSVGSGTGSRKSGDMMLQESISSSSRVPCNERNEHVSSQSEFSDRSEEEMSIEEPPKASRGRSFSVPPSAELFARHRGILRTEATDVVARPRAWTTSSCDDASRYPGAAASTEAESREATGRVDGRRAWTGGASESTSQCAPPTPTAVARSETRPSKGQSVRVGSAIPEVEEKEEEREGESIPIPTSGGGREEEIILSHQEFGLRRWKEYALLRRGNDRRFSGSQHGQKILLDLVSTLRSQEDLERELKETKASVEELNNMLRSEKAEKAKLKSRNILLEREVETIEIARRRWLRDDASCRSRGSNLERRLAGNTENLRNFLFGAGASAEARRVAAPAGSSTKHSVRSSFTGGGSPVARRHSHGVAGGRSPLTPSAGKEDMFAEEGGDAGEDCPDYGGDIALRRVKDTADLEKNELRRRHDVELSKQRSRIENIMLELEKMEAERDGYKRASEIQAELLSGVYSELRACLDEIKSRFAMADTCQSNAHPTRGTKDGDDSVDSSAIRSALARTTQEHEEDPHHQVWFCLSSNRGWIHSGSVNVRTFQILLLEAVLDMALTGVIPPTVRAVRDSIREGMGRTPQAWPSEFRSLDTDRPRSPIVHLGESDLDQPESIGKVCGEHRSVDAESAAVTKRTSPLCRKVLYHLGQNCPPQHSGGGGQTAPAPCVENGLGENGRAGGDLQRTQEKDEAQGVLANQERMRMGYYHASPRSTGGGGDYASFAGPESSGGRFPREVPVEDLKEGDVSRDEIVDHSRGPQSAENEAMDSAIAPTQRGRSGGRSSRWADAHRCCCC